MEPHCTIAANAEPGNMIQNLSEHGEKKCFVPLRLYVATNGMEWNGQRYHNKNDLTLGC